MHDIFVFVVKVSLCTAAVCFVGLGVYSRVSQGTVDVGVIEDNVAIKAITKTFAVQDNVLGQTQTAFLDPINGVALSGVSVTLMGLLIYIYMIISPYNFVYGAVSGGLVSHILFFIIDNVSSPTAGLKLLSLQLVAFATMREGVVLYHLFRCAIYYKMGIPFVFPMLPPIPPVAATGGS